MLGLVAAALFGVSAPLATLLLGATSPQLLAGRLYPGGGLALTAYRRIRPSSVEAPLERADRPTLIAIVLTGGVLAPLLMLYGLERTSAVTGSLFLNLGAPFTVAMALLLVREHVSRLHLRDNRVPQRRRLLPRALRRGSAGVAAVLPPGCRVHGPDKGLCREVSCGGRCCPTGDTCASAPDLAGELLCGSATVLPTATAVRVDVLCLAGNVLGPRERIMLRRNAGISWRTMPGCARRWIQRRKLLCIE